MTVYSVLSWACGECDRVYLAKQEAEACCVCAGCKTKFKRVCYTSKCQRCLYGEILRSARANVRRYESDLKGAQANLARVLKEGKPQ